MVPVRASKAYRGSGGIADSVLILALNRGEWATSRPARFVPKERLGRIQNRCRHFGEEVNICIC